MIDFCLSPLTWLLVCVLTCMRFRGRAWPRRIAIAGATVSVLLMTPLFANALVKSVESTMPLSANCAATAGAYIVVLGGGIDREPSGDEDTSALSASSYRRLITGLTRYRDESDAHLLLVGGGPYGIAESRLMQTLALRWGVQAAAMTIEPASNTTWENARNVAALSPPPPRRFWLVTSSLHMPRALLAFRTAGFEPCPLSSGSMYLAPSGLGYVLPQTSALRKSEAAIHEIVGGLLYRLRAI